MNRSTHFKSRNSICGSSATWCCKPAFTTTGLRAKSACNASLSHSAFRNNLISLRTFGLDDQALLPSVACRLSVNSSCSVANSSDPLADLAVLQQVVGPQKLKQLVSRHPEVLTSHPSPLASWVEFLHQYGLAAGDISKLLLTCPELYVTSSIYESGRTLLFFKQLGWQDADILSRIVPYYPHLLARQLERDICPVLTHLSSLGCSSKDIRLLVWEFPRIFNRDYRRHIRKFQYLGLYGLPPVGTQVKQHPQQQQQQLEANAAEAGSSSSSEELAERLQWLMISVR